MNDTNFYTPYPRSDELYHYGIKGMKWGVRRYENEDGTLTEAGKKRYGTKENYERSRTRKKRILKGAAAATAAAAALGYGIYRKGRKNNGDLINELGVIRRKALTDNSNDPRIIDGSRRMLLSGGKTYRLPAKKIYALEEYSRSREDGPLKRSTARLKGSKNMYNFSTYAMTEPLKRSSVNEFWITNGVRNKRNMYNFTKSGKKENERKEANKFASRKFARSPYMNDVKMMLEYAKGHRGKNDRDIKDIIKYHYSDKPYLKWVDRIDKKYKSDLRKRFYND